MKNTMNAGYGAIPAGSFLEKSLSIQRRRMFDAFMAFTQGDEDDTILDVRATPNRLFESADFLLTWTAPHDRFRITSCDLAPPSCSLPRSAPESNRQKYQQVDGRHLPFSDGQFDWVFCNEVIEHAGSFERQYELLKELTRVSRKGVFVTTPNRWHPFEFNTAMPLLHWLPEGWWRRILKWSGKGVWASESVLNLLDSSGLKKLVSLLPGKPKSDIGHIRYLGIKAHFFLQVQKSPAVKTEKSTPKILPDAILPAESGLPQAAGLSGSDTCQPC